MSGDEVVSTFKNIHGSMSILILLLFIYQAWLGLSIRRQRKRGIGASSRMVKRHRGNGPILVSVRLIGFIAGVILAYIDYKSIFHYPAHIALVILLTLLLLATLFVSRKIEEVDPSWRTLHMLLGISIILLSFVHIALEWRIL